MKCLIQSTHSTNVPKYYAAGLSRVEMPSREVSDLLKVLFEKKMNAEWPCTKASESPQWNMDKLQWDHEVTFNLTSGSPQAFVAKQKQSTMSAASWEQEFLSSYPGPTTDLVCLLEYIIFPFSNAVFSPKILALGM